jgi:hypothetical protein
MVERLKTREILQDPDTQLLGAFGGLSSGAYQTTGDILSASKQINTYVTKRNEIVRRGGSKIISYSQNLTSQAIVDNLSSFQFTFDGIKYFVTKVGAAVSLYSLGATGDYQKAVTKAATFANATDKATFSVVIEGNTCHVLVATAGKALVDLVILSRGVSSLSIGLTTTFSGSISNYPNANIIDNSNTFVYSDNTFVRTTNITQSNFSLSFTTGTPHGLTTASDVKVHSVFRLFGETASYYPGSFLYNSAIRRNSVPLDVNVELPADIFTNPIINENPVQDLSIPTIEIWRNQNNRFFTKTVTSQPNTPNEWDFSDGSYTFTSENTVTRTPNFVSFGGLSASGATERVYVYRLREVLLRPTYTQPPTNISAFIDLVLTPASYYSANAAATSINAKYFNFPNTTRPPLSSVVEIVYTNSTVVNLDPTNTTVTVGDGFIVPLYGLAAFCNSGNNQYLPLVLTVGNRVVMSGFDNRVVFSNANWNYRGMSWNNFQVSTISFGAPSAYVVALTQNSSIVKSVTSVNGVIIAATDTGIFRIAGENAFNTPNATLANVSRVSNEIINTQESLIIYENRVFFVSDNGLFQLQYSQESEEIAQASISNLVSNYFTNKPKVIAYSRFYRGFLISFSNTKEILVFTFDSETWAIFKFAFNSVSIGLSQTIDGYIAVFNQNPNLFTALYCDWTSDATDLVNANALLSDGSPAIPTSTVLPANSVNVTPVTTELSQFNTPAELITMLSNQVQRAYGSNHAQSISGESVLVTEDSGGIKPYPVLSFWVSMAIAGDKIIRNNRVRALNLVVSGNGVVYSSVQFPTADNTYRVIQIEAATINAQGTTIENSAVVFRSYTGDSVNLRQRVMGVSDYWLVAVRLEGNTRMLGWQLDSSAKKRGKLR